VAAVLWTTLGSDADEQFPTPTSAAPAVDGAATDAAPIVTEAAPAPTASIVATAAYDPEGDDGDENSGLVSAAFDGDTTTGWSTSCYSSEYLGGKTGVGLAATLSSASAGTIGVTVGSGPWIIEVYVSDSDEVPGTYAAWGPPIFSDNAIDPTTLQVPVITPVRQVLVSIKQLGRSDRCSSDRPFRGTIDEVRFAPAA